MTEAPHLVVPEIPAKARDKDGLHKRRGIWHYKLKIAGKWKELSTKTTNYQKARKTRHEALQAQVEGRLTPSTQTPPLFRLTPNPSLPIAACHSGICFLGRRGSGVRIAPPRPMNLTT
jgi:hypothetical protein